MGQQALAMAERTHTAHKHTCFICGESYDRSREGAEDLLCSACAATADLPMSHYYMVQYYYGFAD